ncbi:P-loop containing nucleoside triphosphate hydrolase protein, partial [Pavlovales sp. CCMP2436]
MIGAFQRLVFKGVAPQFDAQLQRLLRVLGAGQVHFVRCVKPNGDKKPGRFEGERVLAQLRCGGVMEAVRVFAAGFPDRVLHESVCARFAALAGLPPKPGTAEAAQALLTKLGVNKGQYALGHTKVFFKVGVVPALELRRERLLAENALKCQAAVRGMLARKQARTHLAASRDASDKRRRAAESELALAEMEALVSAERAAEAETTAVAEALARRATEEAVVAVAAEAAAARADDAARSAELLAAKQRAAQLEAALDSARAEMLALREAEAVAAAGAAAAAASDGAPAPPPSPPPTATAVAALALEEARAVSVRAEVEVDELRAQLARAQAELLRERDSSKKLRAEAESTNSMWQGEARRANAELRRTSHLKELERAVWRDKTREFWKEQTQVRWLRDVQKIELKQADANRRSGVSKVADAVSGAAAALLPIVFRSGKSAAAGAGFSAVVPGGGGGSGGSRRRRNPKREVNPSLRAVPDFPAPLAAATAGGRGAAG